MSRLPIFALLTTAAITLAMPAAAASPMDKLDPDMKQVLDAHASLKPKAIETLSAEEAREQPTLADAVEKLMEDRDLDPDDDMDVDTFNLNIPNKPVEIPVRVYKPEDVAKDAKLPVIVYYHGGGWVLADLDTYDATPRIMAKEVGAIVISAHYRQAPEHKFPAAHDDAVTAYRWALDNAPLYGGDPKRMAVMGESAGANLAINTAIAAREQRLPIPLYQVLVYPVAGVNMELPSYIENAEAKPLNKPMMNWFMQNVLKTEADKQDPRLDLIGKADLKKLPPTTIITAEIDPLRSDGMALAMKLKKANVAVKLQDYTGVTHEFFGMGAVVADAKAAEQLVANDLRAALKAK